MLKYEPSEAEVKHAIMNLLDLKRIMWWQQQVGMATYSDNKGKLRSVKYGEKGTSDLASIIGGNKSRNIRGIYVVFEIKKPSAHRFLLKHYDRIASGKCKTKRDWHLLDQINYIENIKDTGNLGYFVSSVDQVEQIIKECHELLGRATS